MSIGKNNTNNNTLALQYIPALAVQQIDTNKHLKSTSNTWLCHF